MNYHFFLCLGRCCPSSWRWVFEEISRSFKGLFKQRKKVSLLLAAMISPFLAFSEESFEKDFYLLPLGVYGGIFEDNLSAYLLTDKDKTDFILMDAGTIMSALLREETQKSLCLLGLKGNNPYELASQVVRNYLKAYLISHAHFDHIAGLVTGSPDDSKKNILGLDSTIDYLQENVFDWKVWPNFGDQGTPPYLNQYSYVRLPVGEIVKIDRTSMSVEALPLSHGNHYLSTAFLVQAGDAYLLYFGDTGPDQVEKSDHLASIWKKITPLVRSKQLKAILIESSYTDDRADSLLFGHLNPRWIFN